MQLYFFLLCLNLFHVIRGESLKSLYNDSLCEEELDKLSSGFTDRTYWALQVIDAWGKIPAGILYGNLNDFGNFDECFDQSNVDLQNDTSPILFQYCLAEWTPKDATSSYTMSQTPSKNQEIRMIAGGSLSNILKLSTGICVPRTCSPQFMQQSLMSLIDEFDLKVSLNYSIEVRIGNDSCQYPMASNFSVGGYLGIVISAIILGGIILSTILNFIAKIDKINHNVYIESFCAFENCNKIFKLVLAKKRTNEIKCLNGLRVLSLVWVVYGHTYINVLAGGIINYKFIPKWIEALWSITLLSATVSVDSFFVFSGLLVTWTMLKYLEKSNGKMNILWMYIHRYIRLTPALCMVLLIFCYVLRYIGTGPIWYSIYDSFLNCDQYWWSLLLYTQNYVNPEKICLGHSWYLSVDMQLFLLSPFIIYPLWKWRNRAIWIVPIFILGSMTCVFTLFLYHNLSLAYMDGLDSVMDRMKLTYYPTHTRMGAWFVGVLLGYLLHANRNKPSVVIPKNIVWMGWIVSIGGMFGICVGMYPLQQFSHKTTVLESAFYETFSRIGWSIGLCWIIYACHYGYGGPLNSFLSATIWQPFSRLSYSIYLVHFPIQILITATTRVPMAFSDPNVIIRFWGDFGVSLTVAVLFSLAFELPLISLEKHLKNRFNEPPKILVNESIENVDTISRT